MPYFRQIKTLFIHIPKTGGSSLEKYLSLKLNIPLDAKSLYSTSKNGYKHVSLQHQTYSTLYKHNKRFDIDFNDLKIISIVRNPYERLVSDLFFFNLINDNTSTSKVYKIIKEYINSNNYDNHNIPQYLFLIDKNNNINKDIKIFKTETLTEELQSYGFVDFNNLYNTNTNKNSNKDYFYFLNSKSIKLINKIYQEDFKLFNYQIIETN
jgi:chondroitin 4-sulfotransferase 11